MKSYRSLAVAIVLMCLIVASYAIFTKQNQSTEYTQIPKTALSNTLRLNLLHDPETADPGLVEDTISGSLVRALFDGLTRRGMDGQPHESVANSIAISRDGLTYTFTLRDSKWSNGDPVTAKDFEYAWKRVINPKTASQYAYQMYCIKNAEKANKGLGNIDAVGIHALNDHTLQVHLEYPTPYFLELTSFYSYYPVHQDTVKKNTQWGLNATTHVSNGPFTLAQWEHNYKIVLEKNPMYWDEKSVKLEQIFFTIINSPQTELSMFEKDEFDWAGAPLGDLPLEKLLPLQKSGQLISYPIAGTYWYKFNSDQPPFQNAKIRKAFAYAINRQAICDNIAIGKTPALGVVPPSMALQPGGYFHDNDQVLARQLLREGIKELGIKKLPPITLSYNTSETHKAIAASIQAQWKEVLGVQVQLHDEDWATYMADLHAGNFQIGRMGWLADYHDPMNFLDQFKEHDQANNDTNWENHDYKKLVNQSARTSNVGQRKELMAQAESILMDEMPVLPIFFYTNSYVKQDRVKNVLLDGLGFVDWKWAYVN